MEHCVIRRAAPGDEKALAYIHTQSWSWALGKMVPQEVLEAQTDEAQAERLYAMILERGLAQVTLALVDGLPQCMAAWRECQDAPEGTAELVCIHSLKDRVGRGYGSKVLLEVMEEMKKAEYHKVVLWVFEDNVRARGFYEKHGLAPTGECREIFGDRELEYEKVL